MHDPFSKQISTPAQKLAAILAAFREKLTKRNVIAGSAVLALFFAIYLAFLYQQLTAAFLKQDEFVPTRIYSNLSLIRAPMSERQILSRLKSLNYTFQKSAGEIRFKGREFNFPSYLIPDSHPTVNAVGKTVTLYFEEGSRSPLSRIEIEGEAVEEIFLEPELIATLSRGSSGPSAIRDPLAFANIPSPVWQAIIAAEDQHFLDHSGFDPRGIARAIFVNLKTLSFAQGGSTLTQQLVKNLMARRTKNVFRKINELFLSLLLELRFTKEAILERYLNEVYLGQIGNMEIHGVAEGAKHFFGKKVDELNLAEIAMMAGLIRGPGFYSPYRHLDRATERQMWVLKKMVDTGQIAQGEAEDAKKLPLRLAPPQSYSNKAPYFADFVKAELIRLMKDRFTEEDIFSQGFRVYTTIDPDLNEAAQMAVRDGVVELEKRYGLDSKVGSTTRLEGALASVDQATGEIRALVGGRNYAESTFNRILNMKRQVGSTFKPIVYLTGLLEGQDAAGVPFTAAYPFEDAPWTLIYDHKKQRWSPRNYDKDHRGWVTMREGLAHSINTVAAKIGARVGVKAIIETAEALGLQSEMPEVPSLALGVSEHTPVELVQAYATLANRGRHNELTVIKTITRDDFKFFAGFVYKPKQVVPEGAVDVLNSMLSSVLEFGTAKAARSMGFTYPAAGKTGTTSDHRDSWFAGFSPNLTTVVWIGFDQTPFEEKKAEEAARDANVKTSVKAPAPKALLTGAGSALPIWVRYMREAHEGMGVVPFPEGESVESVKFDRWTGNLANTFCEGDNVIEDLAWDERIPSESSCTDAAPPSERETTI